MVRVSNYLVADQLAAVDPDSMRALLRRYELPPIFSRDGWGHPFIIEMRRDGNTGSRHYRVIALGRSGKRSSCCRLRIYHDWDLNAVSEDARWLQLWDF
jgi:hypothetical protein